MSRLPSLIRRATTVTRGTEIRFVPRVSARAATIAAWLSGHQSVDRILFTPWALNGLQIGHGDEGGKADAEREAAFSCELSRV
jgi:hypothetical protein